MTSFLTNTFGDFLGDAVAAGLGIEHTDAEFQGRAMSVFLAADTDSSGSLDFNETLVAVKLVPGLKSLTEVQVREMFKRFDADNSEALDLEEFKQLSLLLRRILALNNMSGVIYCGGQLMNPAKNTAIAEKIRLNELYSTPYQPRSPLAKAVAKKTVRRRVVYGGVDLENLDALTDDEVENSTTASKQRFSSADGGSKRSHYWSVTFLEVVYVSLILARLAFALFSTAYTHPDEYHQGVEVAASDIFGVTGSARAWEFTDENPVRSVASVELTAGIAYRVYKFLAKFDQSLLRVTNAMLIVIANGCDTNSLAKGLAAGLRETASRLSFGGEENMETPVAVSFGVLFLAPRVFAFLASLLIDIAVAKAARAAYWARVGTTSSHSKKRSRPHTQSKTMSGASRAGLHARLLIASSWPILALATKPFSNSTECMLVAVLMYIVCGGGGSSGSKEETEGDVSAKRSKKGLREVTSPAFFAGAVTAVGTWTRFTFPLFAAPLLSVLAMKAGTAHGGTTMTKLHGIIVATIAGVVGFILIASALVVLDTSYYRGAGVVIGVFFGDESFSTTDMTAKAHASVRDLAATAMAWFKNPSLPPLDVFSMIWRATVLFVSNVRRHTQQFIKKAIETNWVVAPLNAVTYNLQKDNLQLHGLHNKLTHLLINFPMFFGPLAVFFVGVVLKAVWRILAAGEKKPKKNQSQRKTNTNSPTVSAASALRTSLIWSVVLPLLVLSTAPHQEPRFLLPIAPALVSLAAADGLVVSSGALLVWSLSNVIGATVSGVAHQSGVVPVLKALPELITGEGDGGSSGDASVIFWRTYTPPLSLLADVDGKEASSMIDLAGSDVHSVYESVMGTTGTKPTYLVAPVTAADELSKALEKSDDENEKVKLNLIWRRGAHFSGEELGPIADAFETDGVQGVWDALTLGVYAVEKTG